MPSAAAARRVKAASRVKEAPECSAAGLPEQRVLEIWQGGLRGRRDLVTEDHEPLEIIYPGRPNDDRGADFRDAVIATGRGLLKGDIEIHVRSSLWWAHRHHLDPAYNRVVLHVVYWDDAGRSVVLPNGFTVPTLALHRYYGAQEIRSPALTQPPPLPCLTARCSRNRDAAGVLLDAMGRERFEAKAARFSAAAARDGPAQALYAGVMTALGYTRNSDRMAELAFYLPLRRLEETLEASLADADCLARAQGLLLGKAGLLPSQRGPADLSAGPPDTWPARLEGAWRAAGERPFMAAGDWQVFKVRPGNLPVRRLAAMSVLLARYRRDGLLQGLGEIVQTAPAGGAAACLEAALMVEPAGSWGERLDFYRYGAGPPPALLGRSRAAEIAVNVVLPFAAAGLFPGAAPDLPSKAADIYSAYPAPEGNTVVRHLCRQLNIGRGVVNSALRQQGLLHLYNTRCTQGRCMDCPLGKPKGL